MGSFNPSSKPSVFPTNYPTLIPNISPTLNPTSDPTANPSVSDMNNVSVEEQHTLYTLILLICICCLLLCIIFLILLICKKKKMNANKDKNDDEMMEMHRIKSMSLGNKESQELNAEPDVYSDKNALLLWLKSIGLMEYLDLFIEQGFDTQMSTLSSLTDDDLISIGIEKCAHRKRILLQIKNNKSVIFNVDSDKAEGPLLTGVDDENEDQENDNLYIKGSKQTETGGQETKNGLL